MKKAFKITFALASITLLVGCNLEANPEGAAIMTAVNYEGEQRIVYTLDDDFSTPTYHDERTGKDYGGRHINKGDYKPVWSALQDRLGINLLEHQPAANSGTKKSVDYFRDNWMIKTHADISMGTVYDINNYSVAGNNETILDLKPYIEETKFDEDGNITEKGSLPHIAKFLNDNPGVKMSIITAKHSQPDKGAIYYVPYFDGFDEIDKSPLMRADYVKRLLDDDPDKMTDGYKFSTKTGIIKKHGTAGDKEYDQNYEPCYEENGEALTYNVTIPNVNETGELIDPEVKTISFAKKPAENIISLQNDIINNHPEEANSYTLAKQFRTYIDKRYPAGNNGEKFIFGNHYSDLFLGYKACYDSDELVALMRLVKVSSGTLFKDDKGNEIIKEMITMMPRTCDNQRSADLYRWAGQAFGVRGTESRNSNLYMYMSGEKSYGQEYGRYGKIHDACGDESMLELLKILRALYQEGLILQDFDSKTATGTSEGKFADETLFSGGGEKYAGFMVYDWARDLNDWNKYGTSERKTPCDWITLSPNGDKEVEGKKGYSYGMKAVVGAIAQWDIDGDGTPDGADKGEFMPFTESWTSLKTSALCLNARLADNDEKRAATFKLIDYIFSDEGTYLYNYGPWEDGYITQLAGDGGETWTPDLEKGDPEVDYIEFQGKKFPRLTLNALKEYKGIVEEGGKAKTGYQRRFIGATIPFGFRKLSAVGYQTMEDRTKEGMDIVNKALELGTFKHVLIGAKDDTEKANIKIPFYQICPSAFFLTKGQSSAISNLLDKNKLGSIFTDSSTSNFNIWDSLIMGQDARGGVTFNNYIDKMKEWGVEKIENYYQSAFEIMSEPLE
ncbi:MAG: hypothetical protein MJ214_02275 [Bacilli bacterium]|nr:hypothetical protein [Bacilli bacterium]